MVRGVYWHGMWIVLFRHSTAIYYYYYHSYWTTAISSNYHFFTEITLECEKQTAKVIP